MALTPPPSRSAAEVAAPVDDVGDLCGELDPHPVCTSGRAANTVLRREAARAAEALGLPLFVPPIALSTDNAAMIGAAGFVNFNKGVRAGLELNADPNLRLG
jgi:tRNA A37 threonylcarbamoyltransferase TsaD